MRTRRSSIFSISVFVTISIISFFIYKSTLAPGVIWGDSAKLTILAYENKPIWTDIVGGHPMHTIASSYFASKIDGDNYAYKINLFSALCGSLSTFLIMLIIFLEKNRLYSSSVAGFSLMLSHTFWSYSVVAESYSMIVLFSLINIFLISLACKTKRYFFIFLSGIIFSLSIMINLLLTISFFGVLYIIFFSFKRKGFIIFIAGNLLGLFLINMFLPSEGGIFTPYYNSALSATDAYIFPEKILKEFIKVPFYILYQFPSIFIMFIFLSFFSLKRQREEYLSNGLIISSLTIIIFSVSYLYQRQFVLMILSYTYLCISGGLFLSKIENKLSIQKKIAIFFTTVFMPISVYYFSPKIATSMDVNIIKYRPAHGRDLTYFMSPWKHRHNEPYLWAANLLKKVDIDSIVYADFTLNRVLAYMINIERKRRDVSSVEIDKWIYSKNGKEYYIKDINTFINKGINVYIAQDYDPYYRTELLKKEFNLKCVEGVCQVSKKEKY